jgi:hypothetical protein
LGEDNADEEANVQQNEDETMDPADVEFLANQQNEGANQGEEKEEEHHIHRLIRFYLCKIICNIFIKKCLAYLDIYLLYFYIISIFQYYFR